MAGQADNSIVVDASIDAEGFKAGSKELLNAIKSLANEVRVLGENLKSAFKGSDKSISGTDERAQALEATISSLQEQVKSLQDTVSALQEKLDAATSAPTEVDFDTDAAEAKVSALENKIKELESTIVSLQNGGGGTATQAVDFGGTSQKTSGLQSQIMESEASNTITASVFGITLNLTNLTSKNTDSVISDGLEWSTTLTPTSGKYLPEIVTVTMGGKSCKYEYDGYSGSLKIEKVTGDISVSAVALDAAKLHRPTVEINGTLLTVIPPRFATETNVYIDDTLTWAYIDNSKWEVQEVSGAAKGFTLNASGYYESQCKGISNGYALCKVHLTLDSARSVTFSCISYGESGYDYGIIGQPDKALSISNSDDGATGSANVVHNFRGESSASVRNIVIEVDSGEHDIYVKYRKDSSGDNNNDSLQFTVSL